MPTLQACPPPVPGTKLWGSRVEPAAKVRQSREGPSPQSPAHTVDQ